MKKASVFLMAAGLLVAGAAQAGKLTNREFLEFSEGQRHWWYSGAYTALGHVAFLEDQEKGVCVWNWLAADRERHEALLMKSFKLYPGNYSAHPGERRDERG
jgi:hypothetical protein